MLNIIVLNRNCIRFVILKLYWLSSCRLMNGFLCCSLIVMNVVSLSVVMIDSLMIRFDVN